MHEVRTDFGQRAKELLIYLRHVKFISENARSSTEQATAKSLRAAGYLLAYNLIEATARNTVSAVFDHLRAQGVPFDDLRNELKHLVLKHARARRPDDLVAKFRCIATDIVSQTFDPTEIFSGNVDARKLRYTAKGLGVHSTRASQAASDSLLHVKTHRNDLAHGNKTFAEIGRDTTIEDLRRDSVHAILFMREVIRSTETYLRKRDYLAINQRRRNAQ